MRRLRGSTSQRRFIFIADTSDSTGAGLANLTHSSSGLVAYYIAGDLNNEVQITLVTATLGTFASGGFVAVDNTNMPGWYEVGIPDAALDGGNQVAIQYRGAANMAPVNIYIELDAVDYQDAAAFGLSKFSDVETDTQNIQSRIPAALVDGRIVAVAQSVTDKSGYTLTQAFPANFNLLGIGATGEILTVQEVAELGASALTANGVIDTIPTAVWNALTTASYTDQSFGDRILISTSNNRDVAVTVNNHVAAVLHDANPDSIPEDAFQNGAVSARVIATDAIDGDAIAASALTEITNAVGTLQVLTRLDSMIESDGAGQFRFDTIALEMAPAGGGGGGTDWTANERTAIRAILGVPVSGTTPTDPTTGILDEIRDKTALITSASVQTSIPVTAQGQITGPLYIGDDYLTANGRQFDWTIALPTGFVAATATCKFGMIFEDESGVSEFLVSGTVTDVGSGNVRLRFELPRATTGTLKAGFHRWSTEIVSAAGVEVTAVAYSDRKLVEWREKQT